MGHKIVISIIGLVAALALAACGSAGLQTTPASAPPQVTTDTTAQATGSDVEQGVDKGEATVDSDQEGADVTAPERSYAGTRPAPEFPAGLDWLNTDRPLRLEQLRGKVVLLDFWTYGCINCMHIIPDLERLEAEYPNELVVIGVHSAKFENEGDTDNIRQIILRYGLQHPVVNDHEFQVWRTWGARAWPTLVLIDPAGNIVGGHSGESVYPIFKPVIESLVQEFESKGILDRTLLDLKLEKEGLPETVLSFPGKVLADADGGRLFITDTNHHRIVIADIGGGEVLNVIGGGERGFDDGDFRTATFAQPQGLALSEDSQTLYVADTENHAVRQVDLVAEEVATLVGTGFQARTYPPRGGVAPDVALSSPWDLALGGDQLYIAMAGSHQIWAVDLSTKSVAAFAGSGIEGTQDGPLAHAQLAQPSGLALDGKGRLYFADSESSTIRWAETDSEEGQTGLLAGSGDSLFDFGDVDGVGRDARLQHPLGVAYREGVLYVADTYNSKIKRIDPETSESTTFLGGGHGWRDGTNPLFYEPGGIDAADGTLYVADTNNHAVRVIDLASKETTTLVLKGIERFMASPDDEDFAGKVVQLDPTEVGAGSGKVVLDIELPEGYKVNDQAPSSMAWKVDGDVVVLPSDANRSIVAPEFPLELDATFDRGEGKLAGDLTIIYCEAEKPRICLIEQVRLEVPVKVKDSGDNVLRLRHSIELPEVATQTP